MNTHPGRDAARTGPDRPDGSTDVQPWPAWIRYSVLLVALAVGGIAVIVALYDRGILPIAGPFVAMLVVPLIVFFRRLWLARRAGRR